MKKFISLLIASAMVVSLVPATAFAADVTATAKVVGAQTIVEDDTIALGNSTPELQIKIADAAYTVGEAGTLEVEIELDNAFFTNGFVADVHGAQAGTATTLGYVQIEEFDALDAYDPNLVSGEVNADRNELLLTFNGRFIDGDIIKVRLVTAITDADAGEECTVSVDGDLVEADDLVFVTVADKGIEASIKKLSTVAIDEEVILGKDIVIEEVVDGTFDADVNGTGDSFIYMELSKGFEFGDLTGATVTGAATADPTQPAGYDDNEAVIVITQGNLTTSKDKITIADLEIIADEDVEEGDIATIEFTLYNDGTAAALKSKVAECEVEVAEVCEYKVVMSVDEDKDVPVYYAGVNVANDGISVNDDHISLEVTIEETYPTAWENGEFELTLPEGVYVTKVDVNKDEIGARWDAGDADAAFVEAYREGDYQSFVFEKRAFTENTLNQDCYVLKFELELVANPDFEGEVVLGLVGDDVEESEVVIAEFVPAYTVSAEQNDVIIDYRNTPIDTPIVITEAEADLWTKDMEFYFDMEGEYIDFDDEGDATLTEGDDMEFDYGSVEDKANGHAQLQLDIDKASDDEAAVITIEGIELYMNRSLAAGAYALEHHTSAGTAFLNQDIFAAEGAATFDGDGNRTDAFDYATVGDVDNSDSGYTVNEKFVNIVTAGSDQANTFTTQVIVPVGENVIYSGGVQIELDVPAYISAAGYTMLPVRAVANAIGVATSNVLWDGPTNQVTIIYGTKTIAMVVGQSYMVVNGTSIPTTAAPEITDSRAFLPLRDLATALSISDDKIVWDPDTRTVTLN